MQRVRNGAVVASTTCPVAVGAASAATTWQTPFSLASCALPDPTLAPNLAGTAAVLGIDLYTVTQAILVGAQVVLADVAVGGNTLGGGANGPVAETSYTLARGIGPVRYSSESRLGTPGQWSARLAFARIGSTTIGEQVVAGEADPDVTGAAFTAGPNPTRGALALSFALPEAADASAELFDALGRSVLRADLGPQSAGAGTARLDLSGLASGVYVMRLAAGAVRASTRISVVR